MKKKSVLIVDDNANNINTLADSLRKDYRILVANNGRDALRITHKTKPNIILLDIMMDGMNGFEVCHHLKKHPKTKKIPIIFVSAAAAETYIQKALGVGGIDYIRKPINLIILQHKISRALNESYQQQQFYHAKKLLIRFHSLVNELEKEVTQIQPEIQQVLPPSVHQLITTFKPKQ